MKFPPAVKGTRDFYPAELRLRNWLFDVWRETSRQFGFEEYDACVLEYEELYTRKAGEEIADQLYSFQDRGGRRIALRPEMTPTLARMVFQKRTSTPLPLKWFSIPQCFRYERMTRGRKREHYQWNLDVVGPPDLEAEVEVLSALTMALERLGLGAAQVELRLSDRNILNALLAKMEVPPAKQAPAMIAIDKREKIAPEALDELLAETGLNARQVKGINEFFEAAGDGLPGVEKLLGDRAGATGNLKQLTGLLERIGLGDYVTLDCTIVRGLAYYTGTVFEVRDRAAKLRAVCGGGRYALTLDPARDDAISAVGFGFGDVVILELLADLHLLPELADRVDYAVIPFSQEQAAAGLEVAQRLRRAGFRVKADFSERKFPKKLQLASDMGAAQAVLLMPDELARGQAVVRDMARRSETRVSLADLPPSRS